MQRVLTVFAVVLAAFLACLGAGELVLRATGYSAPIWYQPDPNLGWSLRPGVQGWFTKEGHAYAEISPAGFRDRPHPAAKPAGVYRIALIGDSAAEALQVRLESTFWWQLQEKLRSCPALRGRNLEILNFGVSGYGTTQEALLLESTAIGYQPDFVLLAFAGNDVRNNSARLEPENLRPFFRPDGNGLQLDASFTGKAQFMARASGFYDTYRSASDRLRLVQLVQAARHGIDTWRQAGAAHADSGQRSIPGIEPTTSIAMFAPPRDAAWEEAWTVTERVLARMNAFSARHQARFAVTLISHSAQVHPDRATRKNLQDALGAADLFYIERRIEAVGRREGFAVFALAPDMQKRADAEGAYFHGFSNYRLGWGHWNEQGHRAAAAILAPRICGVL